ncbi:NYN domain-containing protein [Vibrio crassostreae]|uniref:NYN domain-containing protein n=1 Tax=Vibrio crassostreae TaxID=246167 RepID=UPI001B30076C|nr:NYN domain-containing protein [Vibrio crassostreae]
MHKSENRIAVFVDGDNFAAKCYENALEKIKCDGSIVTQKVFGNWTKQILTPWHKVIQENGMDAIQCFDLKKGKNASDIKLVVDALNYIHANRVNTVVLMTSDCDFTPLAISLREMGVKVVVVASGKFNEALKFAADSFHFVSGSVTSGKPVSGEKSEQKNTTAQKITPTLQEKSKFALQGKGGTSYLRMNSFKKRRSFVNAVAKAINYTVIFSELDSVLPQFEFDDDGWFWVTPVSKHLDAIKSFDLTHVCQSLGKTGKSFIENSGLYESKVVDEKKACRKISDLGTIKTEDAGLNTVWKQVSKATTSLIEDGDSGAFREALRSLAEDFGYVGDAAYSTVEDFIAKSPSLKTESADKLVVVSLYRRVELKHSVRDLGVALNTALDKGFYRWSQIESVLNDSGIKLQTFNQTGLSFSVVGLTVGLSTRTVRGECFMYRSELSDAVSDLADRFANTSCTDVVECEKV